MKDSGIFKYICFTNEAISCVPHTGQTCLVSIVQHINICQKTILAFIPRPSSPSKPPSSCMQGNAASQVLPFTQFFFTLMSLPFCEQHLVFNLNILIEVTCHMPLLSVEGYKCLLWCPLPPPPVRFHLSSPLSILFDSREKCESI